MKTFTIMPQKTHVNRPKRGRTGEKSYVCIITLILALDQGQRLVSRSCHRCTLDKRAARSCRNKIKRKFPVP